MDITDNDRRIYGAPRGSALEKALEEAQQHGKRRRKASAEDDNAEDLRGRLERAERARDAAQAEASRLRNERDRVKREAGDGQYFKVGNRGKVQPVDDGKTDPKELARRAWSEMSQKQRNQYLSREIFISAYARKVKQMRGDRG